MEEPKQSFLLYVLGVAGLVAASILFTGRIEPAEIEPLATPSIIMSEPTPPEADSAGCTSAIKELTFAYLPDPAETPHLKDNQVLLHGTVYASDEVTPLPGALVQIWRAEPESETDSLRPFIFRGEAQTNANGQYEFITVKHPGRKVSPFEPVEESLPIYLHYRVIYQADCAPSRQPHFSSDPFPKNPSSASPTLTKPYLEQAETSSLIRQGPVNVVLAIPPPSPQP